MLASARPDPSSNESITESITGQEQPTSFRDSASFDTAVPIEPGQQTVSVSVSVKWALN